MLVGCTGLGSLAHFSEDSGESSNQEDDYESEAGESEEHDDEYVYMDEQLERRSTTGQRLIAGLVLWFSWFRCVQALGGTGLCLVAGLVSWFSWFQCFKAAVGSSAGSGEMRKASDWAVRGKGGTKGLK